VLSEQQERIALAAAQLMTDMHAEQGDGFGRGMLTGVLVALGVTDGEYLQPTIRESFLHGRELLVEAAADAGGAVLMDEIHRWREDGAL
jgi:hypothetical protein